MNWGDWVGVGLGCHTRSLFGKLRNWIWKSEEIGILLEITHLDLDKVWMNHWSRGVGGHTSLYKEEDVTSISMFICIFSYMQNHENDWYYKVPEVPFNRLRIHYLEGAVFLRLHRKCVR